MTLLAVSQASSHVTVCTHRTRQRHTVLVTRSFAPQLQLAQPARCNVVRYQLQRGPRTASLAASSRLARLRCRVEAEGDAERLPEGARVRVKQSIKVFHAPKRKEGLDLEGLEGEVMAYVDNYKGKKLSSNLPLKVRFVLDNEEGKQSKFFSHLAPDEVEAI